MKNIIDYSQYTTLHFKEPRRFVEIDKLFESKGIPNILKSITKELVDGIKKNESFIYDYNYDNFNVSGVINKHVYNEEEIYATSKFGIYYIKMKNTQIDVYLPTVYSELELERVVTHELLHIYEIFNRIKNNTKKDLQWGLVNIIQKIRNKYTDTFIEELWFLIYISSDQEINARIAETYTILMDLRTINIELLNYEIKKCKSWEYSDVLEKFNFNNYNINYDLLKDFLTELNTLMNKKYKINFNLYKIPNNEKDCKEILKEWTILFKKKSIKIKEKLSKLIEEVINDVKMIESLSVNNDGTITLNESLKRKSKFFKIDRL